MPAGGILPQTAPTVQAAPEQTQREAITQVDPNELVLGASDVDDAQNPYRAPAPARPEGCLGPARDLVAV